MDGKLSMAELRGQQAAVIKSNFALADTNKDGFIDQNELNAAMQFIRSRGRGPAAQQAPTPAAKPTASTN
jgi:Ca2+-binding EF-hand superfamily protein